MTEKIASLIKSLKSAINQGHTRSVKAKKNIILSILIRGTSIAISLVLVPLTINYINPSRYGIWLTLSAIIGWFSFFDIGLSNGLRNKFAEAKASGNDTLAQIYVSTTYAILAIIFGILWLFFLFCNTFLDWAHLLKISESMNKEISLLAVIIFSYFCLQFVLRIITTIISANQESAKASMIDLLGQALSLTLVFILVKTTEGSLIKLGLALCVSPIVVLILANFFLFKGVYKKYRPVLAKVKFSYAKGLFNLGIIFFVIQVSGIIQFETANILIARNFGTAEVTNYNIVYKYFGMTNLIITIFLTPFWSASTEAYFKNDIEWIKNGIKKYNILNLLLIAVGVVMLVFSEFIYKLWLGSGKVDIPFALSLWGFIFFNITMFGNKYVIFLNGISALRIQFWANAISPFLYIAFSIILVKYYHMGVYSFFISSILANFNVYFLAPLQYNQIINRKKKGIWTK